MGEWRVVRSPFCSIKPFEHTYQKLECIHYKIAYKLNGNGQVILLVPESDFI